jgi:phage gp16-like protein
MGDRNQAAVQPRQTVSGAIQANPKASREERASRAMIQKVQIARRQLGLDDESYRAVLLRITGQTSSTACTVRDLDALLREFTRLGFQPRPARKTSPKAQVRMIYAVWADIAHLLRSDADKTAALRSFVKRQTGVDAPEFLDAAQANKVLEGLKAWRTRLRRNQTQENTDADA